MHLTHRCKSRSQIGVPQFSDLISNLAEPLIVDEETLIIEGYFTIIALPGISLA